MTPIVEMNDLRGRFKGERTVAVMATLVDILVTVERLATDESRSSLQSWESALMKPAIQEIGWTPRPDDTDDRRELRALLFFPLGVLAREVFSWDAAIGWIAEVEYDERRQPKPTPFCRC